LEKLFDGKEKVCSWLTGKGVGGVVMRVVVLEIEEEEDMNLVLVF